VLDLFTRKIVGWAMRDHMRAELTIAALTMAIRRQNPPPGLIHHSDRGSQYAAADYRKVLDKAGMIQSMSRKGNRWDNAPMESCFGTIKTKLVHETCYPTRDAARHDLFAYIEGYYNRSGFIPPSGISPPNKQNVAPLDPVSTKAGKGQGVAVDTVFEGKRKRSPTTRTRAVLIADMMILEGEAALKPAR
jgi:hypothetical protein